MFSNNEQSLKEVLEALIRSYRMTGKLNEISVVQSWNKVTGPVISKHTRKIRMSHGRLYVTLDSAALRSELNYSRQRLIALLNEEAGSEVVKEIVFV